ncbi:hypothetical protein GJAV_G00131210 [Gymnothorax javanicus]|nr:hypothetical protein GJAV_G00131210 [Gymnothorax javanicus]
MNVKILTLVIALLASLLCSGSAEEGDHKEQLREGTQQPITLEPTMSFQTAGKSSGCRTLPIVLQQCTTLTCETHDLHRAWQAVRAGGCEQAGTAEPSQECPEPQTGWLEEETSSTSPLSQGTYAILEEAWSRASSPIV